MLMQAYNFELEGMAQRISLALDPSVREQVRKASRSFTYTGTRPTDWRTSYYNMFLAHPSVQAPVTQLLAELKALRPNPTPDQLAELAVAFVQGALEYDWKTYHGVEQGGMRYPYETLFDRTGVCADKAFLLARILMTLGYGVALFTFERANHMAVGLLAPAGFGHYGTPYTYVESTDYSPIGRVPDKLHGGVRLEGKPIVTVVGNGTLAFQKIRENRAKEEALVKQYGKDILNMNPTQQGLRKEMAVIEQELADLKAKLRGCQGTLPPARYEECRQLQATHNAKVEAYNQLVARFNAANR